MRSPGWSSALAAGESLDSSSTTRPEGVLNDDENSAVTKGPSRDCQGVPMGLLPTHGNEKPRFSTAANRAATVRSGND